MVNPILVVVLLVVVIAGWWLASRVFDGLTDAAFSAASLPFRALLDRAVDNRNAHALTTAQRFRSAVPVAAASQIISTLPGVADTAADGQPSPHYRHREPGRVAVAVGTDAQTRYEAAVTLRPADAGGTVGEVTVTSWTGDIDDALEAHRGLLDTVFPALQAADPELTVTTENTAGSGARLSDPPAGAWPSHRRHTNSVMRHLPTLPTAAIILFTIALLVAIVVGSGVFHTTTKAELCSSYSSAAAAMSDDDKFDVTDEMRDLADKAKGYDDDDVRDDGKAVDNLGRYFGGSAFSSATSKIEEECS